MSTSIYFSAMSRHTLRASVGCGKAIDPHHLFVSGNKYDALPLRAWLDDSDSSSSAYGMMLVPLAERKGDSSSWRMPARR